MSLTTPISFSQIQAQFGGSTPLRISNYYQGGSIMGPGVYPNTVPFGNAISFGNFVGTPVEYTWEQNQQTSGDQPDDGCAWNASYSNGAYGQTGWGLYVAVAIYGDGSAISVNNPQGDGSYQSWCIIRVTAANTNTYGTLYNNYNNQFGYFGNPYANWDGASTLRIYGNNGSGSPGDPGYAYATALVRTNWNSMSGGTNFMVVAI